MDERASPAQCKAFTPKHPTCCRTLPQIQHSFKGSTWVTPNPALSLSGHFFFPLRTQESLIVLLHLPYTPATGSTTVYSTGSFKHPHIFSLPRWPFPLLFAQNHQHMSWVLTAFGAWQHSHPFISSQHGHLPTFLPFQILLTQDETNTNQESSLTCPREINPFCQIQAVSLC